MKRIITSVVAVALLLTTVLGAAPQKQNKVKYVKYERDAVLKKIMDQQKEKEKKAAAVTREIIDRHMAEKKEAREKYRQMKSDFTGVFPPASPQVFKQYFHFPPQAQYMTSTCWSFSATSYYESEIFRLTGKKIKLSEIWTAYWELLEKCRGFIRERGHSFVAGGGESNAFQRIWKTYGIVPLTDYTGLIDPKALHNHGPLMKELKAFLNYIKKNNLWDEKAGLAHITMILNRHLGAPPRTITFAGKTMTPLEFLKNETGLNMDDYYSVMSTSSVPFYTFQEFKVPDNWWHSREYLNLPLGEWYAIIRKAATSGHTLVIGGDISEPGKCGSGDIAFVPTFDIPARYINQDAREYRIYNKTSTDDHGIHLVGFKRVRGKDWYLIKDSGRSARKGKHKGYYFFREDFIKLKMLTFTVHKDLLTRALKKVNK